MLKLVTFVALLSLAAARPSILSPVPVIASPGLVRVVPAPVSHQSITQIHARPVLVSPVVHPLPLVPVPIHPHVVAGPVLAHPGPVLVHG